MVSLAITVSLGPKENLVFRGRKDPEDTLVHQDLMGFQVKWVLLAHPRWTTASW